MNYGNHFTKDGQVEVILRSAYEDYKKGTMDLDTFIDRVEERLNIYLNE